MKKTLNIFIKMFFILILCGFIWYNYNAGRIFFKDYLL